jgi:NADH-quinone oxidoreductase subunit F
VDLYLPDASPTGAERAAVDGVLGPPASSWEGADARTSQDTRVVHLGHEARERRHLLLPVLAKVQAEIGWVSPGALTYVCRRLQVPPAEAYGVASFYALLSLEERPPRVAHVCDDVVCREKGALGLIEDLERTIGPEGEPAGDVAWMRSPCLGRCETPPAVYCQRAGVEDAVVTGADADSVLATLRSDEASSPPLDLPQADDPGLRILRRIGVVDPEDLDDYRAAGGYAALRRAVEIGPRGVLREVDDSQLKGRGGAAFPAGVKWNGVATNPVHPHYLICNADESEPGTFKDRVLMEGDPFALIEAMTITGYAVGAERGYLYIRGEYPVATARLLRAIETCRNRGLLGEDVMGAGFAFDVELRQGQGAYICGEETALMESIEGKRGEPRNKPPFPTDVGLFGKPTVVNNVETLLNVLDIVVEGGPAFAQIGTPESTGTKLFAVAGSVTRPGVYEVPFGTTLGELIDLAGGVDGGELQTVLLGGAAGSFVTPDQLDVPLTFEGAREHGLFLGSGAVTVFDDGVDLAQTVSRIAAFFRDESCGQCVPCRVGTVRVEEALVRHFAGGNGEPELIDEIDRAMKDASICGLGHTAGSAVRSALNLGLLGGDGR